MYNTKILFININFRTDNSSGITISKLVDHIPAENLFLLSTTAEISDMDIFGSKKQLGKPQEIDKIRSTKKSFLRKIFVKIIGQKTIFQKLILGDEVKQWLDKICPDYVYFCPESLVNIEVSNEIANYCNSKIIIHVADDKVSINFPGILGSLYKSKFNQAFEDIVFRSSIRLSISDLMAEEYLKRYGKEFHTFHNPIDYNKWQKYRKASFLLNKEKIKIVYTGQVESAFQPILEFCKALKTINNQEFNIKLILYSKFRSQIEREKIDSFSFTKINEYVTQEKIPETLAQADFLFLPLSFNKNMKFIYFSMPTKTAEYMASGIPIIVYAPSGTALSKYASNGKWGHIINSNKKEDVIDGIIELLENKILQKKYTQNAIRLVKEKHDTKTDKLRFMKLLDGVENV